MEALLHALSSLLRNLTWDVDSDSSPPTPLSSPARDVAPPRLGRGRRPRPDVPTRASTRLAKKQPPGFVAIAAKATHLKAMRHNLASCSSALKKQVKGRKLLKRGNPLGALDLKRLAKATNVASDAVRAATLTGGSLVGAP